MNWEELNYKLSHLKIERDRELEQQTQQKNQNQRILENQHYNKSDIFQDKLNPYNYILPFEGEQQENSDNFEYLETQYDDDDEDYDHEGENYYNEENDQDQEDLIKVQQNKNCILKYEEQIAQSQKINNQQCQFFEDFDEKENDCFAEINQNDKNSVNIKNSDYFPPQKKPLEQIAFQNQQNVPQSYQQKQKSSDNSSQLVKKQGYQDQLNINMINTYTTLGKFNKFNLPLFNQQQSTNSLSICCQSSLYLKGTGSFGRVKLAKIKGNDKDVFALKMMKKLEIVKLKQVDHIKSEKKILSQIRHPFLVELKGAFQDECYIYMLFEFLSGGEIFSRLRKEGRFSNDISMFYISEIYMALQYLHSQNIVYRDLKPENLLIDRDGHVKIADFGFAKIMDSARTYTLCGTPEYLAPEIIQGAKTGYGKSVDWWALGVLIFEMLSGHPPFYDTDPMGIYQKIVKSIINFPEFFSLRIKDLIRKLLNPNINHRLGCADDGDSIKNHKWFKGINWEKVYNKQIPSPWIPQLKSKDDVSCFEKYPESRDNLENPSKEIQKLFIDF